MARGNKNSKLNVERRKAAELKLFQEHPEAANWTQQQICDAINASNRLAVQRDLAEIAEPLVISNGEKREAHQLQQLRTFELIERSLVAGNVAAEVAREWLHVRAEISRLLGLNAESRSMRLNLNVDASADATSEFARWKRASAGLTEAQKNIELARIEALPRDMVTIEPMPRQLGDGNVD